jgi:DNA-binding MarR family transcriptional regulator
MPNSRISEQDVMLFFQSLMEASHAVHMFVEKVFFAKSDITLHQFGVLKQLMARGWSVSTMTELWCDHHTTKGNITGMIDRMIDAGLVSRTEDKTDRRQKKISITKLGIKKHTEIESTMRAHVPEFMKKIDNLPLRELTDSLIMIKQIHLSGIEKYTSLK